MTAKILRPVLVGMVVMFALATLQLDAPEAKERGNAIQSLDAATLVRERAEAVFLEQQLVGLSMGIVRGGRVVETFHFGSEDREKAIPASDRTMYRWASISKPITAILAMQLAEREMLDLDADVRTLVPEFPEKPHRVTSRQLLCHQGGIVHYSNGEVIRSFREYGREHPFEDVINALDYFRESPLVAEPGTKYSYTTHGYMLLGAVVERAGRQRFISQTHTRLITPLKLDSLQPDYEWRSIPNRATGYRRAANGEIRPVVSADVSWKLAGGGFISTVGDLAGFAAALARRDERLLKLDTFNAVWERQPTRDGNASTYGLGFSIGTVMGTELLQVGHSGSQQKARTQMLIAPDTGDAIVIMSNSEWANLGALARESLRTLVEESLAFAAAEE